MPCTNCVCCKASPCANSNITELNKNDCIIDFQPITKQFIADNRAVIASADMRLCDLTPGCLYMWRDFYRMRAAIVAGMLVCIAGDPDTNGVLSTNARYYTCPVGNGDFAAAIKAIQSDARSRGAMFKMCTVPDEAVERIECAIGKKAEVDSSVDRPDFLYPYENFLGYAGKALHAQRNHINRFRRENPEYRFEPLTCENRDAAQAFLREHHTDLSKGNAMSDEDLKRTEELLDCFETLKLSGGILYAGERAVGFTMGEALGDTLHVHVEKADHTVHGAYQMLAMEFALYMRSPALKYINRQDDAEDEGLYRSKMSYRPIALLNKNILSF
ncbi:MAG: DUF2156 domain-containing protein [Clostridia bacterium]|nr:DUF2156 domain-containing protein [Clostridia bacterium]